MANSDHVHARKYHVRMWRIRDDGTGMIEVLPSFMNLSSVQLSTCGNWLIVQDGSQIRYIRIPSVVTEVSIDSQERPE